MASGMSDKVTLGYWKIRGLAQPIRYALVYAGQAYEENLYEQGEGPEYSRAEWDNVKNTIGLDFPNLPYLIDGDIKLTQSNAILRHIGSSHNLLGESPKEKATCDMMLETAMDLRNSLVSLVYGGHYEEKVDGYFKGKVSKFEGYEKFLNGKDWFAGGKKPTICDFHMYELLDQHILMRPGSLDNYTNLLAFMKRFEALPSIAAFQKSPNFIKRPVNNKCGAWK